MDTATRFPFDYDLLVKGTNIPADECEHVLGISRDSAKYSLAMMNLIEVVQKELTAREMNVTVVSQKCGIRVLTDEEASTYNAQQCHIALARQIRAFGRLRQVDSSEFDDTNKMQHDRHLLVIGRTIQGALNERKIAQKEWLIEHKRDLPLALPEKV
jgi:hypothetical protein